MEHQLDRLRDSPSRHMNPIIDTNGLEPAEREALLFLRDRCDVRPVPRSREMTPEFEVELHGERYLFELKAQSRTASEAAHKMGEALACRAESLEEKIATLRRLRDDLAAMASALHECEPCEAVHFPQRCPTCDVMARPDLPRAMRLLWTSSK